MQGRFSNRLYHPCPLQKFLCSPPPQVSSPRAAVGTLPPQHMHIPVLRQEPEYLIVPCAVVVSFLVPDVSLAAASSVAARLSITWAAVFPCPLNHRAREMILGHVFRNNERNDHRWLQRDGPPTAKSCPHLSLT